MVQSFMVVRCFSCCVFQVQQVKKVNTFTCKMCNEKQSVKKVILRGSGAECRQYVQELNMKSSSAANQARHRHVNDEPRQMHEFDHDFHDFESSRRDSFDRPATDTGDCVAYVPRGKSKWQRYVDDDSHAAFTAESHQQQFSSHSSEGYAGRDLSTEEEGHPGNYASPIAMSGTSSGLRVASNRTTSKWQYLLDKCDTSPTEVSGGNVTDCIDKKAIRGGAAAVRGARPLPTLGCLPTTRGSAASLYNDKSSSTLDAQTSDRHCVSENVPREAPQQRRSSKLNSGVRSAVYHSSKFNQQPISDSMTHSVSTEGHEHTPLAKRPTPFGLWNGGERRSIAVTLAGGGPQQDSAATCPSMSVCGDELVDCTRPRRTAVPCSNRQRQCIPPPSSTVSDIADGYDHGGVRFGMVESVTASCRVPAVRVARDDLDLFSVVDSDGPISAAEDCLCHVDRYSESLQLGRTYCTTHKLEQSHGSLSEVCDGRVTSSDESSSQYQQLPTPATGSFSLPANKVSSALSSISSTSTLARPSSSKSMTSDIVSVSSKQPTGKPLSSEVTVLPAVTRMSLFTTDDDFNDDDWSI